MGNQLVGVAPSQIFPVEHYMTVPNLFDIRYESSMGSTRFLKVARANSDEGWVVVKVFVKHDPTLPLECYSDKLDLIKKTLANAVNCLPFQRSTVTDKAAILIREYVHHSLFDRISTRPFLTTIEKKWITFQVLCALHQCHKQKICHGDIKLENILITSWNWILLSDFASFKPTYLPEDNPADYSYFFDTSRRRTCYIAPERFVKTMSTDANQQQSLVGDGPCFGENLLPEMDIFSAGCALLELWTEGTAPFEFSQLLAYRNDEKDLVAKHLAGIENERLRHLIASMLSKNPKDRKSAELYLDQERDKLFPEYFYSFLQSYIQIFSSTPIQPPDEKIKCLHSDIKQIIKMLAAADPKDGDEKADKERPPSADNDGLILITAVVTSTIRGLKHSTSKLSCLDILQQLAANTASETILDRLLPFILCLAQDSAPNVRVAALDTLTTCLTYVKNLPRSDANVFPEYILPSIAPLAVDTATIVRVAYAKNIATLAETAVNFLEQSQIKCSPEMPAPKYEIELAALHEMLHQTVLNLLIDQQAIVKQTLLESGITKLCVFFGRQKANDIILSHIITFLNDKEDKNLRGSFFDCIVGVAAYVGWHCSPILIPLLQQGLTDSEEFVIAKSLRATTALTELGLIQKAGLIEFISECACYLNHPNLWVRHEVCGLISTAAGTLSAIDVQCKIMPSIGNHLKCPLIQVEKPELLLDCLQTPIPRSIFDAVLSFTDINQLLEVLRERKLARLKVSEGVLPQYGEMGQTLQNLFRRLTSEGLNDQIETQLLAMSTHLIKLHRYKSMGDKTANNRKGLIRIDAKRKDQICRELVLGSAIDPNSKGVKLELGPIAQTRKQRKAEAEWQVYSPADNSPSPTSPAHDSPVAPVLTMTTLSTNTTQATPSSSLVEYSMPEAVNMAENLSACRSEFDKLATNLKSEYGAYALSEEFCDRNLTPNWRLQGTLVAHLHEHRAVVTRMTALRPFSSFFASVSIDGTVRLWDCNKLDGQQSINRSRQAYSANTPLSAIAACDGGQSLAVAGKDGALLLLRIDPNSNKMALQQARNLDTDYRQEARDHEDGPVVDMCSIGAGGMQSMIVYATLYGAIVGWDIRQPGNVWRLESDLRNGVITSLCIDPTGSWLAVGTSSGHHIVWDLRFKLPIAKIKHPHDARIRRVACHPTESSWLVSASQGNNEVFVWNIETGHRQAAFWASPAPPLSNPSNNSKSHSVGALLTGSTDTSGFVLTGGTDQRIRHWDVEYPENCGMVVPPPKDQQAQMAVTYDSRLIDGTRVIQEIQSPASITTANQPRSGPEIPAAGHHDMITDLVLCKTQKQTFVASSSRDGVIKLWK